MVRRRHLRGHAPKCEALIRTDSVFLETSGMAGNKWHGGDYQLFVLGLRTLKV